MTDSPGSVWVRTVPDPDGTYHPVLEIDEDTAFPLTPDTAHAHATAVLAAVARAEYDAAVLHQMGSGGEQNRQHAGQLVRALREDRPPIAWPSPLTLDPGVSAFTGRPFVVVQIHGRPVGQWTPQDARGHAVHVLEVVEGARLDTAYHQRLVGFGVDPGKAARIVDDLGNHREAEPTGGP